MNLTDKEIKAIKPVNKPKYKSDGNGLYIYVSPIKVGGRISYHYKWMYRYTSPVTGQQVWYKGKIGDYPNVSLKEARQIRGELARCSDPNAELERKKKEVILERIKSFEDVFDIWYEYWRKTVAPTTEEKIMSRYNCHIKTSKNNKKLICDITTLDISTDLNKLSAPSAEKVKGIYNMVFTFAINEGYGIDREGKTIINPVPKGTLLSHRTYTEKKHPGITDKEKLPNLIKNIYGYGGNPIVRGALIFLLHCATRSSEMRHIKWKDIDWENKIITVQNTKNKHSLKVPMSYQVEDMLNELKDIRGNSLRMDDYIFHKRGDFKTPISNVTTNAALQLMGYDTQKEHTTHGFRTTFSTFAHEMWDSKYGRDVIEKQLDHVVGTGVARIYDKSEHLECRRALLQDWSDFLDEIGYSKKAAA